MVMLCGPLKKNGPNTIKRNDILAVIKELLILKKEDYIMSDYLKHYGILGNKDGSLTEAGKKRYRKYLNPDESIKNNPESKFTTKLGSTYTARYIEEYGNVMWATEKEWAEIKRTNDILREIYNSYYGKIIS